MDLTWLCSAFKIQVILNIRVAVRLLRSEDLGLEFPICKKVWLRQIYAEMVGSKLSIEKMSGIQIKLKSTRSGGQKLTPVKHSLVQ